jgi:uridylate kinase
MKRVILKISGEALANQSGSGINPKYINKIALEIKTLHDKGAQIGIVNGAGNMWRGRDAKAYGMPRTHADYMGMLGTIFNSLALQSSLENLGLEVKVMSALSVPAVAEDYNSRIAKKYLEENKIVIFAGGTGSPYFSTDTTAALRAAEVNAEYILMAKNGVDGVYNDDPRKNPEAKRYTHLSYDDMMNQHLEVMDLTAATLCRENDIKIVVFDMNVEGNISKAYEDTSIGTLIEK